MDLESRLDNEIAHIRSEITKLRAHKQRLSSALLGSNRIQKHIDARKSSVPRSAGRDDTCSLDKKVEEAIDQEKQKNDIKVHRLGFGVTAFPFTDHAPERDAPRTTQESMLGVRFDLHPTSQELGISQEKDDDGKKDVQVKEDTSKGSEEEGQPTTYLLLLRKLQLNNMTYLKLYQHNVPKHVDVELYEDKYLPLPSALQDHDNENLDAQDDRQNHAMEDTMREDEDSFQDDSGIDLTITEDVQAQSIAIDSSINTNIRGNNQSLHQFVTAIHTSLRSWHYRSQYIAHLRASLGLFQTTSASFPNATRQEPKFSIYTLDKTTYDARHVQIVWTTGALGLLKIDYDGFIERAVVYGPAASSPQSETHDNETNDSELSESEDDEASNFASSDNRTSLQNKQRAKQQQEHNEHIRLHTIECLLMRTESDERVHVQDLTKRLQIVEKELL